MKLRNLAFGLTVLAGLLVSGVASADHDEGSVGVYFGAPFTYGDQDFWGDDDGWPGYQPYYAPVVVAPQPPPVYIEQPAPPPRGGNYWYHCNNPEGYYPYVRTCPGGWQAVIPSPPPR